MNYILDFDWTLFDNSIVKKKLEEQGALEYWRHRETWKYVDPKECFYDDVLDWLLSKDKESLSVLSVHEGPEYSQDAEVFQKQKVALSGITAYVREVAVVAGKKVDHIQPLLRGGETNVFVDDVPLQLMGVKERYPEILCVRMKRENGIHNDEVLEGSQMPEVGSLVELDLLLKEKV